MGFTFNQRKKLTNTVRNIAKRKQEFPEGWRNIAKVDSSKKEAEGSLNISNGLLHEASQLTHIQNGIAPQIDKERDTN